MGGMFGGSGTTANTLAYMLWATLQQPELVKELRKELQSTFPGGAGQVPDSVVSRSVTMIDVVMLEVCL